MLGAKWRIVSAALRGWGTGIVLRTSTVDERNVTRSMNLYPFTNETIYTYSSKKYT